MYCSPANNFEQRFTMYRAPATGLKFMPFFARKKPPAGTYHLQVQFFVAAKPELCVHITEAPRSGADVDHAISHVPATGLKFVPFSKRKMPPAGTYHLRLQFFVAAITLQGRPLFSHRGGAAQRRRQRLHYISCSRERSKFTPFFSRKKPPAGTYRLRVQIFVPGVIFKPRALSSHHGGAAQRRRRRLHYILCSHERPRIHASFFQGRRQAHPSSTACSSSPFCSTSRYTQRHETSGALPSKFDFSTSRELGRGTASAASIFESFACGASLPQVDIDIWCSPCIPATDPGTLKLYPSNSSKTSAAGAFSRQDASITILLEKSPPRAPTNMFSICRQAKYQSLDSELELAPPRLELYSTGERSSSTTGIKFNHTVK
ncbi:hypothetical protein C8R43DRAFT_1211087 [Mycena crocata]|nr:hypothetical protein C8R43DRAFT_957911 [Mycena crocata]KAJ7127232.1 hypothetical protein C8R43DRAFT_1211087 [Mycena crocata]